MRSDRMRPAPGYKQDPRRCCRRTQMCPADVSLHDRNPPPRLLTPFERSRPSVRELPPVVLEDETDRRQHDGKHTNQEKPPSDRDAESCRARGEAEEKRPPAMRAEEPDLPCALADFALRVVLRPRRQPHPGEQHVEPGEEGQPDGQRERRGARRIVREVPVDDVRAAEEPRAPEEQPAFNLHEDLVMDSWAAREALPALTWG